MQFQSVAGNRPGRAAGRRLRAIADTLANQARRWGRHSRPQRERTFAGSPGDRRPATTSTTVAPPGRRGASGDAAGTPQAAGIRSRRRIAAKPHKYQALVTLYPPGDGGPDAEPPRHVRRLAVRPDPLGGHHTGLFSALVSAADGSLLRPGTVDIVATIVVLGDDVGDDLAPGEQFALLSGGEVGHGVVTRRLFT